MTTHLISTEDLGSFTSEQIIASSTKENKKLQIRSFLITGKIKSYLAVLHHDRCVYTTKRLKDAVKFYNNIT